MTDTTLEAEYGEKRERDRRGTLGGMIADIKRGGGGMSGSIWCVLRV